MSSQSKGLFSLSILVCLFLIGCNSGGFEPSGRNVPKIIDDISNGNYDKSLPPHEAVAYDYCDCLSNIDWKLVMGRIERIEGGDLEAKGISDEQKYREQGNFNNIMSCTFITISDKYEGYVVNDASVDSVLMVVEQKCPAIYADFMEFEKRNWKDEE